MCSENSCKFAKNTQNYRKKIFIQSNHKQNVHFRESISKKRSSTVNENDNSNHANDNTTFTEQTSKKLQILYKTLARKTRDAKSSQLIAAH